MRAYGDVVAGHDDGAAPLFGSETASGVSRRSAQLPTSFEVAPVVVAYLRQVGGESLVPRELEALLPAEAAAPPRARETVMLVAAVVLLFVAALAVALVLLPRALS